jgi:hypothetical protein
MNQSFRFLPILLAALVAGGAVGGEPPRPADDLPPHVEINVRNVLWQFLPEGVEEVSVGPDQRTWYIMTAPPEWPADIGSIKRLIEREFPKQNPQLCVAVPILFEPGGRVWFLAPANASVQALLGYDGHSWIERHAAKWHRFSGAVPVDGHILFPSTEGVHCFDGKEWTYKEFLRKDGDIRMPHVFLYSLADGKTVVGVTPDGEIWQWQAGRWTQGLDAILKRLGDAEFKVRQGAMVELLSLSPCGLPQIEAALKDAKDPEVRSRLEQAVETMKVFCIWGDALKNVTMTFGGYRLREPQHISMPLPGLMIGAQDIEKDGKSLGPGLLLVSSGGEVRMIPGADMVEAFEVKVVGLCPLVVQEPGNRVWSPKGLVDLDKGKIVDRSPIDECSYVKGVRSDGTVYFSMSNEVIAVYRPGATDDRRFLDAREVSLAKAWSVVSLGPDQAVWANAPDGKAGLCRFDGKQWTAVLPPADPPAAGSDGAAAPFIPCLGGAVIGLDPSGACELVAREKTLKAATLEDLIESHPKEMAAALQPGRGPADLGDYTGLLADGAGNIWLYGADQWGGALPAQRLPRREDTRGGFWVRAGDKWLDGAKALADAGVTKGVMYMTPMPDGRKVYVATPAPENQDGKAFFAEVKQGKLVLEKAPPMDFRYGFEFSARCIRDKDGAVWIPWKFMQRDDEHFCATRVTGDGQVQEFKDAGLPCLAEGNGNVWLNQGPSGKFNIWRDGKVAAEISIPFANHATFFGQMGYGMSWNRTWLVSDRPGSVFTWTSTGLYHLVADDPKNPAQYKMKAHYYIRGFQGMASFAGYSPLGYIVVSNGLSLYLIVPPKD